MFEKIATFHRIIQIKVAKQGKLKSAKNVKKRLVLYEKFIVFVKFMLILGIFQKNS